MNIIRAHLLPLAIVLIIAGALFHIQGIDTSADSLWYLLASANLASNTGYLDFAGEAITNRGPLFAWLLSLGQSPTVNPEQALNTGYLVMRAALVVNLVLVYLATSALFTRWTGLAAVVLCALTFAFHSAHSRIIIDPFVPMFVLLTLWLLACVRPLGVIQAGLAGGALGLGFVAKEVVVVFAGAPFVYSLLLTLRGRSWRVMTLFSYLFCFVLVIAVWALASGLIRDDLGDLLGWAGPKALAIFGVGQQAPMLTNDNGGVWGAIVRLYTDHLMALGWLTPAALLAVVINMMSLRRGHLLLSAFILCWLPVAFYIGLAGLRPGQSLVLVMLLLMSLAGAVCASVGNLLRDFDWPRSATVASALLAIALCSVHGVLQHKTHDLLLGENVNRTHAIVWPASADSQSPDSARVKTVGIWPRVSRLHEALSETLDDNAVILTDVYHGSGLALLNRSQQGSGASAFKFANLDQIAVDANAAAISDIRSPLLLLGPRWNPLRHNNLVLISAERINQTLTEHAITHIVLAGRHRQLTEVFAKQDGFEPVELPKDIAANVYKVTRPATPTYNNGLQPPMAFDLTEQLMQLQSDSPAALEHVIDQIKARLDIDVGAALKSG